MSENTSNSQLPRVGLTHGDINGISYEIILKAFSDSRMLGMMTPILYGQSKAFSYYKKNFGLDDFNYSLTRDARQSWNQKFNILNIVDQELKIEPGMTTSLSAEMSVLSLKKATEDLRDGYVDALVMSPDCPSVAATQMDYLNATFDKPDVLRLLVSDKIRVGLTTDKMPLREALAQLDAPRVVKKLATLSAALKSDFNIASPKIAVMGLNPTAQADAQDFVVAAVKEAQQKDVFAFGPFSASSLFVQGLWKKYDAVLALYYEQGTLPFKIMSLNGGAYYWVGLPAVCAGPMHGPGFDIANANQASPDSFRAALYLALDILNCRGDRI